MIRYKHTLGIISPLIYKTKRHISYKNEDIINILLMMKISLLGNGIKSSHFLTTIFSLLIKWTDKD